MVTVRKNQQNLTDAERQNFVNAVLQIKKTGEYDSFVQLHLDIMKSDMTAPPGAPRYGHMNSGFLPWHRQLLLRFERALQRVNASVSLPYWDWAGDRSKLFTDNFMGGDGTEIGDKVMTGPFAYDKGNWTINIGATGNSDPKANVNFLRRQIGQGKGGTIQLASREEIDNALAQTVYHTAPYDKTTAYGFCNYVEGNINSPRMHNAAHVWIGGHMNEFHSPNDPVFWLNHCYVDKLWADWQKMHPSAGYVPVNPTTGTVGLNEPLKSFEPVRPVDMLDYKRYYLYDNDL